MNLESKITIFTDGSSRGNPGPGGFGAVIVYNDCELGVPSDKLKVKEIGGREEHTTNNRMELMAAISALAVIPNSKFLIQVYCDSSYVINGITKWVFGWQKNGWKTATKKEVENRDLWEKLFELTNSKIYRSIEWKQVGGHVGVAGNERCDEIATRFADGEKPELYSGAFASYRIKNILDVKEDSWASGTKNSSKNHSKAKAYSYISCVDGKVLLHKTWAECEARVKGVRGAKFKKSLNVNDEKSIVEAWSS